MLGRAGTVDTAIARVSDPQLGRSEILKDNPALRAVWSFAPLFLLVIASALCLALCDVCIMQVYLVAYLCQLHKYGE